MPQNKTGLLGGPFLRTCRVNWPEAEDEGAGCSPQEANIKASNTLENRVL